MKPPTRSSRTKVASYADMSAGRLIKTPMQVTQTGSKSATPQSPAISDSSVGIAEGTHLPVPKVEINSIDCISAGSPQLPALIITLPTPNMHLGQGAIGNDASLSQGEGDVLTQRTTPVRKGDQLVDDKGEKRKRKCKPQPNPPLFTPYQEPLPRTMDGTASVLQNTRHDPNAPEASAMQSVTTANPLASATPDDTKLNGKFTPRQTLRLNPPKPPPPVGDLQGKKRKRTVGDYGDDTFDASPLIQSTGAGEDIAIILPSQGEERALKTLQRRMESVIDYLDRVKDRFQDHPGVCDQLLDLMRQFQPVFKEVRVLTDTLDVFDRQLFTILDGHPDLIESFREILSPSWDGTVIPETVNSPVRLPPQNGKKKQSEGRKKRKVDEAANTPAMPSSHHSENSPLERPRGKKRKRSFDEIGGDASKVSPSNSSAVSGGIKIIIPPSQEVAETATTFNAPMKQPRTSVRKKQSDGRKKRKIDDAANAPARATPHYSERPLLGSTSWIQRKHSAEEMEDTTSGGPPTGPPAVSAERTTIITLSQELAEIPATLNAPIAQHSMNTTTDEIPSLAFLKNPPPRDPDRKVLKWSDGTVTTHPSNLGGCQHGPRTDTKDYGKAHPPPRPNKKATKKLVTAGVAQSDALHPLHVQEPIYDHLSAGPEEELGVEEDPWINSTDRRKPQLNVNEHRVV